MSCICDCFSRCRRRRKYEPLPGLVEEATVGRKTTGPLRKLSEGSTRENTPDREPTGSLCRPIEESAVSSNSCTIDSKGLVFSQSGFALRIPAGALHNDEVAGMKVDIHYPVSKPRCMPERSELVSGVCHIDSKETELRKSGSLVIDHCMDIRRAEDCASVGVIRHEGRRVSVSSGSHHFQYVNDSDVDVKGDYVEVTLWKMEPAYYAVVCPKERREAVGYCGLLYREAVLLSCTKFYFMVIKDLFFYVKEVQESCAARKLEKAYEPMPLTFAAAPQGEEMKLTLDVKKEGIRNKGWHIYPCAWPADTEILECDAYNYHPKHCSIPSIELQAVWIQSAPGPDTLVEFLNIRGTKRPKLLTLQYELRRPYPQETPDFTVPKMSELVKCVGRKGKHNILEEIGKDYYEFGVFLLGDETGTIVNGIEWQYQRHFEAINREILRRWLEGRGRKPVQWTTLIQVLKDMSRHTLAEDIEYGLMDRI